MLITGMAFKLTVVYLRSALITGIVLHWSLCLSNLLLSHNKLTFFFLISFFSVLHYLYYNNVHHKIKYTIDGLEILEEEGKQYRKILFSVYNEVKTFDIYQSLENLNFPRVQEFICYILLSEELAITYFHFRNPESLFL